MSGEFEVRYTEAARDDVLRLFDFLLERAKTPEDFDDAQLVLDTLVREIEGSLSRAPFIFRKVGESPFLRELIIPFRGFGYVALYEIEEGAKVNVLALRHQLEDDYH
jgi:plasmid stabilization system protein ParE